MLLSPNHTIKVGLAAPMRQETTMDFKWIAKELAVGSRKYLSNLLNKEAHASAPYEKQWKLHQYGEVENPS